MLSFFAFCLKKRSSPCSSFSKFSRSKLLEREKNLLKSGDWKYCWLNTKLLNYYPSQFSPLSILCEINMVLCHFHSYRPSQNQCISIEFRAICKICISKYVPKCIISRIGIPCFRVFNQQNIVTKPFCPKKKQTRTEYLWWKFCALTVVAWCPSAITAQRKFQMTKKNISGPISIASNLCISWNSHLVHFLLTFNFDFVGF